MEKLRNAGEQLKAMFICLSHDNKLTCNDCVNCESCQNSYFNTDDVFLEAVITICDAMDEYEELKQAEEQGLLVKITCHCKDCMDANRSGCSGTTIYCTRNECYMQEDDFCVYADRVMEE